MEWQIGFSFPSANKFENVQNKYSHECQWGTNIRIKHTEMLWIKIILNKIKTMKYVLWFREGLDWLITFKKPWKANSEEVFLLPVHTL